MKQSVRLGRIAGVPVGAHWSVVVIVAALWWILGAQVFPGMVPEQAAAWYWTAAGVTALLFVLALLGHELAHAVVARHRGVAVGSITLWALGGVTELGSDPPTPRADLAIAAAGPAASLGATAVFGGAGAAAHALHGPGLLVGALVWLGFMNGMLAVFNLLPGAPLDGGRILRALLWLRHGDQARAARTAASAGRVVGVLLIGLGIAEFIAWRAAGGLWFALIGLFIISAATAEAAAGSASAALAGLRVRDVMTPHPAVGALWMSVADFIDRVAMHTPQTSFPVVGFDGTVRGVTGLDMLRRIPAQQHTTVSLQQVMVAVPPGYLAGPEDPAAPLLNRRPLAGEVSAIVLADGRIVGLVTVDDLRRVIKRGALRAEPAQVRPAA